MEGLAPALRQRGYSPWVDRYDLKAQENWKDAVDQAMREAQAAVFLIDDLSPFLTVIRNTSGEPQSALRPTASNGPWFHCYSTALSGQAF